jgi:hypothetical protein
MNNEASYRQFNPNTFDKMKRKVGCKVTKELSIHTFPTPHTIREEEDWQVIVSRILMI